MVVDVGKELGVKVICAPSNIEGELVEYIDYSCHLAGVIFNACVYTHYSWALHDPIEAIPSPVVQVHISNPHTREEWRHQSCVTTVCKGTITGAGIFGYELGLRLAIKEAQGS